MSQLAPIKPHKPLSVSLSDDTYHAYADNFDLSLLPNETELPLSPQSEYSTSSSSSSTSSSSTSELLLPSSTEVSPYTQSSQTSSSATNNVSLEYIPTTIYHDQTVTQIKIEKPWSDENLSSSTTLNHTNSILLEQLQHHYKFYPSPQPSPDHFHHHQQLNNNGPPATVNASIYPPSPCPSIDAKSPYSSSQLHHQIKQELHILPPSPPESSCGAPSPHSFADIKQEPDEAFIDINSLLEKSLSSMRQETTTNHNNTTPNDSKPHIVSHHHQNQHHLQHQLTQHQQQSSSQDNQLLREYLEDTTFQKKHNLKPLALETLIGGLGVRGDIEPVISLALEHAKREAEATCNKLQISADPQKWTPPQVHAWLRSTADQFKLPPIIDLELKFPEDGTTLSLLTEEEFVRRAPEAGSTIHAQLEIWKLACSDNFSNNFNANPNNNNVVTPLNTQAVAPTTTTTNTATATPSVVTDIWNSECIQQSMDMDVSDDDEEETIPPGTVNSSPAMASTVTNSGPSATTTPSPATKTPTGRTGGSHIHLWQFLKELLATPHVNGTAIRWIDRSKGVFKIEDSVRVAKLWGRRKNRPAMNYDKLSRSIRQYYKKGIMKKTERSQRLVYQFCHPYCL
ncbi:DNA-binding protein D-ETS-4 isoform X2 [Episyrphus balteatus]|nr:DNA-binding protein D-ETS-4 isoform X2 [Episyrphus balteatus]XP_055854215.1 DNA-binding protein D-ETS-4 isoform X2 [Episyrphus balteatus]